MCGLNGVFSVNETSFQLKEKILLMNQAMAHRGPDDEGCWSEGSVALGHRRLSIIDLSADGHQPMLSPDSRYVLIFNGEIYNYRKLRQQFPDYPFRSHSDSEVILAAYERWGKNCLTHLSGMFAFAIWDRREQELFIARDRLGIKPLYFYQHADYLVFASEIRSLLASELVPRKLDQDSLVDYLRYQTVQAPKTIVQGVRMLMPGHYLSASSDSITEGCYWDPVHLTDQIIYDSRKGWKKRIHETLAHAVEEQMVADVPFGAFLSGGIDSSALVGLMSEVATEQVKTFCVTFAEEEFSEARYARIIAKKFKTDHHEIQLSPQDFLNDLPAALSAMDHPSGDGPNTYFISKATKMAGVTMAFSGLGGDELFAGYDIFKRSAQLSQFAWLNAFPQVLRKKIGKGIYNFRPSVASAKVADILELNEIGATQAYPINRQVLMNSQIQKLLHVGKLPDNKVSAAIALFTDQKKFAQMPLLSRISLCEISTYMQNVLLRDTDQMSMANALEVRVPFLDHNLVELVLQIPDAFKYPNTPKQLLVESLGDLLPNEVVNRPKMGFTLPFDQWMKNELKGFCDQRLTALSNRAYFDKAEVNALWRDFSSGKATVSWSRIWILVVLEDWLAKNGVE